MTDAPMLFRIQIATAIALAIGLVKPPRLAAEERIDFRSEVAPLLEEHCLGCHNPGILKGDLSLATDEQLVALGHIVPGDPDASYLVELITAADGQPAAMPKEASPLSEAQVALIRRWIAEGAVWPDDLVLRERARADAGWWSLQPLSRTAAEGGDAARQTIDGFILRRLDEQGLSLNPPADRRTLIRRVFYDLIGLPPTPEEVEAFVSDPDADAYRRLVDRLLESPHYGERWGRHWLDVVRFGESNGFERNVIIDSLWPFRDYVIRSLNEDKPFDQFIREHIAGDVIGDGNPDQAVGTAFLVAGPYDDVGNQDPAQAAQIRANTLDEIIGVTGQAFLGLTVGCSRCHDHKFDPITQEDYYALYATFAGVRHGAVPLATPEATAARQKALAPLEQQVAQLEAEEKDLTDRIRQRAEENLAEYELRWTRPAVDRMGTEETFETVTARFVRLICEARDDNPAAASGFRIDEFEVWSAGPESVNVALAARGGKATGPARQIEDFPDAYGPQLAIDGEFGARFISTGTDLTIELPEPTPINRVLFSSARYEERPDHGKYSFVADYRIEVSSDGQSWQEVAHGRDRRPVGWDEGHRSHLHHRLLKLEITDDEQAERGRLRQELVRIRRSIAEVPELPMVWIGTRNVTDAEGPFHVFLGGDPGRKGPQVIPASLEVFDRSATGPDGAEMPSYQLDDGADEAERRRALADWIVHPANPLTPRVLANRVWQHHFGTGLVDTPNDFGYMGGRPSHPQLLDFLARRLIESGWRLKPLHRLIVTSRTYRQSSRFDEAAAGIDGDARLLWRFPPRRLSAEEIRDTMLAIAGKLDRQVILTNGQSDGAVSPDPMSLVPDGGPGFRLYHFMQDNVCTYVPLDHHGPETWRRAVYHQNARASVVDLMTDFDQPDCALSVPRRAETTTPLQALTLLNHSFTLEMADAMAERIAGEAPASSRDQIDRAYRICFGRSPEPDEVDACLELVDRHGLDALCRVLLNTSELIFVE